MVLMVLVIVVAAREQVPTMRGFSHLAIRERTLYVGSRRSTGYQGAKTRLAAHSCAASGPPGSSGSIAVTRA
jgi:hypothetical protein